MKTRYFICARRAIRDASDNDITLVGIIEDTNVPGFPMIVPRCYVIWGLEREEGDEQRFGCVIKFYLDDELLGEFAASVDFQDKTVTRSILSLAGLQIARPGRMRITVGVGEDEKARYEFVVSAVAQVVEGPAPAGGYIVA